MCGLLGDQWFSPVLEKMLREEVTPKGNVANLQAKPVGVKKAVRVNIQETSRKSPRTDGLMKEGTAL